jgi:MFS family permease
VNPTHKAVALLSTCQALLMTNNSILIATTGLAGFALAPEKAWATVPVTAYVCGGALSTIGLSQLMRRVGRRNGFMVGSIVGIFGALICALAIHLQHFWVLCMGTLVLGGYNAAAQYYRFAAADVANTEFKAKAISLVLAGGIVGAIVGPETSKLTKDLWEPAFLGSYLSLTLFCALAIAVQSRLRIPPPNAEEQKGGGRSIAQLARQPAFVIAVAAGAVGYGVMNLLMTATPLAMQACQYPFKEAAFVIQWHILGMFVPSFFTGSLIKRFGLIPVMVTGVALNLVCVAVALHGIAIWNFWLAMVLVGVGWNFMYVGATALLTETYKPEEKARAQGFNEMMIFLTLAMSSLFSGALFTLQGWERINMLAAPFLIAVGVALLWLGVRRRAPGSI